MNVLILAAGYGVRLHPITQVISKALIQVNGKPMIEHVVDKFSRFGEITIVTNQKFADDFNNWRKLFVENHPEVPIRIINNGSTSVDNRLGANGDIVYSIEHGELNDSDLLIVGSDNLFTEPQDDFVKFAADKPATIATFDLGSREAVKRFAAVSADTNGRVLSFEEKPDQPTSTLAGTMLYHLAATTVPLTREFIDSGGNPDNAGYLFGWLGGKVDTFAFPLKGQWIDVGSHESLERAHSMCASGSSLTGNEYYRENDR
ncbi:MAG: NTP transferase domain-containing protein [Verrucomicrobiaceae bacterium]|nr:NTP transferase domain-containing protein [Verrucomicrobiaceae bacterium]